MAGKKKTAARKEAEQKKTITETTKKQKTKNTAVKKKKLSTEDISNNISNNTKQGVKTKGNEKKYYTNDGHRLTIKEYKFIDNYLATGNGRQSVIEAGYTSKAPETYANSLLCKNYIANEISYRMTHEHEERIASGQEVMEFYSKVMRGEIKDQFELDAPLSERLKAANEIAKRTVDIANRAAGVTHGENEITIKLDWDRNGV